MSSPKESNGYAFTKPRKYRIRVMGTLNDSFSDRMDDMQIIARDFEDREIPDDQIGRYGAGPGGIVEHIGNPL